LFLWTWSPTRKYSDEIIDLNVNIQTGAYRALPSRRTYIPKADGRQRPLGAALEDKIVEGGGLAVFVRLPMENEPFYAKARSDASRNSDSLW
jgi:hypothetical protein